MKKKSSKQLSTKAWIKAEKQKESRKGLAIFLALILLAIVPLTYYSYNVLSRSNSQIITHELKPKAAIVDQLSLTFPNQTFIETATNILKQAGYSVDYYSGEAVTVNFYRNLPKHGYKIIILRVHSALGWYGEPPVCLFTSEPYSQDRFIYEQLTDQLTRAYYNVSGEGKYYFGILPEFIRSSMNGKFEKAIVFMMGCNGLSYIDMAKAFTDKGAKVYIGWYNSVSVSHTDTATVKLLQHYLIEKLTLKQSIQETFKEVGLDPAYKSLLVYYPPEAGEQKIE
jgi:hypothetical protein